MELIELLNTRGIEYKKTNNPSEILISCTSGLHNDSNPSLSYNLDKNIFHCWSCGFGGGASKFLESIGEVTRLPVDSKQPYRIKKLQDALAKLKGDKTFKKFMGRLGENMEFMNGPDYEKVRAEKKKEKKENLIFLSLISSVILITAFIASF